MNRPGNRVRPQLATDGDLILTVHVWLPALVVVPLVAFVGLRAWRARWWRTSFEIVSVTIPFGPGGAITLKRTNDVVRLAHEAWVEIMTRKTGVAFDSDNDVIVEVYDSHYALFAELRKIARSVPAETLSHSPDAQRLADLLIRSLNEGLRPHLTVWQARFRTWYKEERKTSGSEAPQDTQKRFDKYDALVKDLVEVQGRMSSFADELHGVVTGKDYEDGSPS